MENQVETKPQQYRQGDVLLIPVDDIPNGAKKVQRDNGRVILAYGEVTGHAHAITVPGADKFRVRTDVGGGPINLRDMSPRIAEYLRVREEAELKHEEHATIKVPPGNYRVAIQREYTPQIVRSVRD